MSITRKLRKWVEDNRTRLYMGGLSPYEVGTIADEIDAEHKRLAVLADVRDVLDAIGREGGGRR